MAADNITQKEVEKLLNKLIKLHYFEIQEFAVAPNDQEILIVLGNSDMPYGQYIYDERNRSIWKCTIDTGSVVQLTLPEEDTFAPSWSPDCQRISYISRASGKKEIWVMDQDGSNKRQLTSSKHAGKDPFNEAETKWSPDGRMIAYTVQPNGSFYGLWQSFIKKQEGPTHIQVEKGENKLQVAEQQARATFTSSVYMINLETGENKPITPNSERAYFIMTWCDEGLLVRKGSKLLKINPYTLHVEELYDGHLGLIKALGTILLLARIREKHLELGYIQENDFIIKREVPIMGHDPITFHAWANDGSQLFFSSQEGLSNILYSVNAHTGEINALTEKGKTVQDLTCMAIAQSYHKRESILFPYSDPHNPIELWEATGSGEIRKVSNLCKKIQPESLPKVEIIKYVSRGWEIESLLVFPKNYDSTKTYPTLVYLHGGPEYYVRANFSELMSGRAESAAYFLAEQGYAIFLPNFRGSSGYGEAFEYELSHYKLMQAPYEDVIAGVDYLINARIANPEKLGIYGSSFGAHLTAWTISQTTRFKGAIGMVGEYDPLQTDRYMNSSFHSMSENRSKGTIANDLWFEPDVYKKFSPMEHFEKIITPMLFIETSAERELNGSSSRTLFNALITRGIKTNLVYYPEAFHNGGWNDVYKKDYMKRVVAWFDYCIKGKDLPDWFEK
ncbi:prolyl oligopeptidase family serine peptidase [Lederbergia sp. NSJ-179]|uniref:S9 family peptidase n=1 Tax=Lederbergia sp. NSJ-179 TaxID=2931402 RepID=UPI001FD337B0|nr:prolyl oligopeptidase family serine peptidase [Lederbergia sp. NSJ-179]MCJ7843595.1 prolyl oligopeptidase family serine peptidase [Lederbergia sp. NSJ-179]